MSLMGSSADTSSPALSRLIPREAPAMSDKPGEPTPTTTYTQDNPREIAELLVGRRIVQAEKGTFDYPGRGWREQPDGRLVLDDGTVLYLAGHDGGCGCNAGCYPLEKVAMADNVITSARVECDPHDDSDDDRDTGAYRIFVFADATEINVAEFVGSDGNGYYGTGFELTVVRAGETQR